MLHLIIRIIPAAVHRALLPVAYRVRHRWRTWRKVPLAGCNVILTDLNGSILLLQHSYGPAAWYLPGGGIGKGEDPLAAAVREVREELGLELVRLNALGTFDGVISGSPHTMHLFAATIDLHPQPDGREVTEARFFPPHSLPEPLSGMARRALEHWRDNRDGS
ncbi:NUDIX domain-containing protein [Altererythrobacter sp. BO-6]|uniref:NUDIX hydrolase n=1 Tax=Altererythrobacter sp. BO-6 TaxID=2604537 RepID=UPI001F49F64A|nr:NUDIX domain-containing protein [Altererythrobacter sp. BO-6]